MSIRGQIAFRDQGKAGDGRHYAIGVGIIEAPKGLLSEHVIRGFAISGKDDKPVFATTEYVGDISDEARATGLSHLSTLKVWPSPSAFYGLPGGGLMFRRTKAPAECDHEILSVLVLACIDPGRIRMAHMYDFDGICSDTWPSGVNSRSSSFSMRFDLHDPRPCTDMRGNAFAEILKQPMWGFGDEPFAFYSDLDLASINEVRELDRLLAVEEPDEQQTKRIEYLKRTPGGQILSIGCRDETYMRFRREFYREVGLQDWSRVMTRAEIEARDKIADEIVRRLVAEERNHGAGPRP